MANKSPLRAYRKEHKLSTKQLADRLGYAESTVRSFENGNRTISADQAVDIETKIGIQRSKIRPDLWPNQKAAA